MKIPIILAESSSGGGRGARLAAPTGDGLANVGPALDRAAKNALIIAQAEDAKRQHLGKQEAGAAEAALDTAITTHDSDLQLTERDPEVYEQKIKQHAREKAAETLQGLKTEEGRALLSAKVPILLKRLDASARKHGNALYKDRSRALTDQNLADLVIKGGLTDVGDEDAFQELLAKGKQAIDDSMLGANERGDAERKFVDNLPSERARRHRDLDPGHFEEVADRKYPLMDPKRRDEFKKQARAEVDRREDRAVAAQDKAEKKLAADYKLFADGIESDLEQLVATGAATMREIDEAQRRYRFSAATYNRLRDGVQKPKTTPSDPNISARVGLDVESLYPRTTEAEIDALHDKYRQGQPGLSLPDALKYKNQLRSTREALRKEGKSDLERAHNQAEQELRAAVGIPPGILVSALGDSPAARLYAAYLPQLTRRSALFKDVHGGTENPLMVVKEIRPAIINALTDQKQARVLELQSGLLYATPEAAKAALAAGKIDEGLYRGQMRLFEEIEKSTPTPTTGKPKDGKSKERK